jgi:putative FmdB family regulatory protein
MPIYEYECRDCHNRFETLVSSARQPSCPACHGHALDKQLSVFAVSAKSGGSAGSFDAPGGCGTCGDPRGPGSCRMN